jgi:predicted nucleic acid-binding protein
MIVVDTNIIAYLHVSGNFTSSALLLLGKDPHWIAPPLWQSEFRNALVNYVRHNIITLENAVGLMNEALITMQNREVAASTELILLHAANNTGSAYDCEFVALAQETNSRLVTVDKQITKNFPQTAILLNEFIK